MLPKNNVYLYLINQSSTKTNITIYFFEIPPMDILHEFGCIYVKDDLKSLLKAFYQIVVGPCKTLQIQKVYKNSYFLSSVLNPLSPLENSRFEFQNIFRSKQPTRIGCIWRFNYDSIAYFLSFFFFLKFRFAVWRSSTRTKIKRCD